MGVYKTWKQSHYPVAVDKPRRGPIRAPLLWGSELVFSLAWARLDSCTVGFVWRVYWTVRTVKSSSCQRCGCCCHEPEILEGSCTRSGPSTLATYAVCALRTVRPRLCLRLRQDPVKKVSEFINICYNYRRLSCVPNDYSKMTCRSPSISEQKSIG